MNTQPSPGESRVRTILVFIGVVAVCLLVLLLMYCALGVLVAPRPGGGLTHASASLRSRYGDVSVSWRLDDGDLRVDVSLPPNTAATVSLPDREPVRLGSGDHTL